MAKVITFSRTFPAYHPRKGQPTRFAEKLLNSLNIAYREESTQLIEANSDRIKSGLIQKIDILEFRIGLDMWNTDDKHHTIRAGHRFKVGDKFSPRVWSGKPYNSKQIILAPDVEVVKVWDFQIRLFSHGGPYSYEGYVNGMPCCKMHEVAHNDGLTIGDFADWFKMDNAQEYLKSVLFDGQIICWSNSINY